MKFITSEKDLILEDGFICFYSSKSPTYLNNILFRSLSKLDKNVLCLDLYYMNLYKKFNIKEIPTLTYFKNSKEINRITLTSIKFSINDILLW